jgi:hypothetical protein
MKHFPFLTLLLPIALLAGSAYAADEAAPRGWLDHHKHPHGQVYGERTSSAARKDGTAVYGWSSRYRDCGAYHYWDGESCVDARDTPPSIK